MPFLGDSGSRVRLCRSRCMAAVAGGSWGREVEGVGRGEGMAAY